MLWSFLKIFDLQKKKKKNISISTVKKGSDIPQQLFSNV